MRWVARLKPIWPNWFAWYPVNTGAYWVWLEWVQYHINPDKKRVYRILVEGVKKPVLVRRVVDEESPWMD